MSRNSYNICMSRRVLRSRLSEKGQVTIPKPLRRSLGLRPGQILEFEEREGTLVGRKVMERSGVDAVVGILGHGEVDVDELINEMRGKPWNPEDDAPHADRD